MSNIKNENNENDLNQENVEGDNENNADNKTNEIFLGNKKLISKNRKTDNLIKEYKIKNKFRRSFNQKTPLNK